MSNPDIDNLDHDPELAIALGNLVVAWARAETALMTIIYKITDMPLDMANVAYHRIPTFESRTKVILAMIDGWDENDTVREQYTAAVTKLGKLASTRNHWVHGVWCFDRPTRTTILFDYRAPEDSRRKPVKAADVNNHLNAVRRRTKDIEDITGLRVPLLPSPRKSP